MLQLSHSRPSRQILQTTIMKRIPSIKIEEVTEFLPNSDDITTNTSNFISQIRGLAELRRANLETYQLHIQQRQNVAAASLTPTTPRNSASTNSTISPNSTAQPSTQSTYHPTHLSNYPLCRTLGRNNPRGTNRTINVEEGDSISSDSDSLFDSLTNLRPTDLQIHLSSSDSDSSTIPPTETTTEHAKNRIVTHLSQHTSTTQTQILPTSPSSSPHPSTDLIQDNNPIINDNSPSIILSPPTIHVGPFLQ